MTVSPCAKECESDDDLMSVDGLEVAFKPPTGVVRAVRGVSLRVRRGEILGIAGESGCGKSVMFRAMLGLLPPTASVSGRLRFTGETIGISGPLQTRASLISQHPGAALNPVFTIGHQLALVAGTDDRDALAGALARAGLPDPGRVLDAYPHELSGGMSQRAVIALGLARRTPLLIADEPTTALDVTTQAQVLDLLEELRAAHGLTVVLISHDLAVIRKVCDRLIVLYAGKVAETGPVEQVLNLPRHPYTQALLKSIPRPEAVGADLASIPGQVPDGRSEIAGCVFAPRCAHVRNGCLQAQPRLRSVSSEHSAACILVDAE